MTFNINNHPELIGNSICHFSTKDTICYSLAMTKKGHTLDVDMQTGDIFLPKGLTCNEICLNHKLFFPLEKSKSSEKVFFFVTVLLHKSNKNNLRM